MFPPEVIDIVLSFLQWDHASLQVCARAHPLLSSLVERHLYAHLTVQNFGHKHRSGAYFPSELLKHIVNKPSITKHIRSLQMCLIPFRHYQELESILLVVPQLQLQNICLAYLSATPVVWDNLSESFRSAFINCLRLPTLTQVSLSNIRGFLLSTLDHSSSLKRLSLMGDFSYLPPISPIVHPPLDSLDLYCSSSMAMESVASWMESRGLRSLQLNHNLEQSPRLLGVCSNTLTTLNVRVSDDYRSLHLNTSSDRTYSPPFTPIPFSLAHLPHLERLTLQVPISLIGLYQHSCLHSTMQLLDTLPSPPTNLILLVIHTDIHIVDNINYISDTNWFPLVLFPYFDVIPRFELRVFARKMRKPIPSVELLEILKRDRHLMQLEGHNSFLINALDDLDQTQGYIY